MTQQTPTSTYGIGVGTSSTGPFVDIFQPFDPTTSDVNFKIQQKWLNTQTREYWILQNFSTIGGVTKANWVSISLGVAQLDSLTTQDSAVVFPTSSGSIFISGSAGELTTSGNVSTDTVTISYTSPTTTPGNMIVTGNLITSTVTSSTGNLSIQTGGANGNINLTPNGTGTVVTNRITINNPPTIGTDGTNKAYVDSVASGADYEAPVFAATNPSTDNYTVTYNNGTAGVGSTLTNAGTQTVFTIDGDTPSVTERVLIKDQNSNLPYNGIYTVTNVGSGSTNWVLTRATDYDTPAEMLAGTFIPVLFGDTNYSTIWTLLETVATVGTTPVVFLQFGAGPLINTQYNVMVGTGVAGVLTSVPPSATAGVPLVSTGASSNPDFGTATVPGGGTGVTGFGNTQSLVVTGATGTSSLGSLGPGTIQQLLSSNGPGVYPSYKTFTVNHLGFQVGNYTYTPSPGMVYVDVFCLAGGGGGGFAASCPASASGGGGGGSGGYIRYVYSAADVGASQAVTVGDGGSGAYLPSQSTGFGGGTSSFLTISAGGGLGGETGNVGFNSGAIGGAGGSRIGPGNNQSNGGSGGTCYYNNLQAASLGGTSVGGEGAASIYGSGGSGNLASINTAVSGSNGMAYGSGGGGGGACNTSGTGNGGNGAPGFVFLVEYIIN